MSSARHCCAITTSPPNRLPSRPDALMRAKERKGDGSLGPLFDIPEPTVSVQIVVNEPIEIYKLPEETATKTSFNTRTGALTFRGTMTEHDREALKSIYSSNEAKAAVEQ